MQLVKEVTFDRRYVVFNNNTIRLRSMKLSLINPPRHWRIMMNISEEVSQFLLKIMINRINGDILSLVIIRMTARGRANE